MTFITHSILAIALATPTIQDCSRTPGSLKGQRAFTNADLERMAACRYQTGAQSKVGTGATEAPGQPNRQSSAAAARGRERTEHLEADWRAQWRSVDQKARTLRRQAHELRQEAGESLRNPKKPVQGRRSPTLLITRAGALEAEARELEQEFSDRARREGALPGWIRAKGR